MKKHTTFVCLFAAAIAAGTAIVGGINYLVDPYGLYRADNPTILGGEIQIRDAASKVSALDRVRPRGIILGTSRAELGLDPEHPGWSKGSSPRFNLAFPANSMTVARRYLEYAHSLRPLEQLVLGLDYAMFQLNRSKQDEAYGDLLDKYAHARQRLEKRASQLIHTLLSYDALRASIASLRPGATQAPVGRQPEAPAPTTSAMERYLPNGRRDESGLAKSQRHFGHNRMFTRMLRKMKRQQLLNLRAYRMSAGLEAETNNRYMAELHSLLRLCREHAIDLRVFISPIHARYRELLDRPEDGRRYSRWLADVTRVVNEVNDEYPDLRPILLRDFSGENAYTTEEVPPRGDRTTEMRWYWEASHYKKVLGDRVLDVVFSDEQVPEFGRIISRSRGRESS